MIAAALLIVLLAASAAAAEVPAVSGQVFAASRDGDFGVSRALLDARRQLDDHIAARITYDVRPDGALKLKYAFGRWATGPLAAEAGLVPSPWLAWEQRVNRYRVVGELYLQRAGVLATADEGAHVTTRHGGLAATGGVYDRAGDHYYRGMAQGAAGPLRVAAGATWDGEAAAYAMAALTGSRGALAGQVCRGRVDGWSVFADVPAGPLRVFGWRDDGWTAGAAWPRAWGQLVAARNDGALLLAVELRL